MEEEGTEKVYSTIIVGAGPCGLAAGIELRKRDQDPLILEKGSVTESIRNYPLRMSFFSTAENISIGGMPFPTSNVKPTRIEALQYYRKLAGYFGLNMSLYTTVTAISKDEEGIFSVVTEERGSFQARNVILATGYFDIPRKLEVPGEDLPHVSHYYREPFEYSYTKVVIVGAGNSAIEAALELYRHDVDVTIVHRGEDLKPTAKYWLVPDLRNRIEEGKIDVRFNTTVQRIGEDVVAINGPEGEEKLHADFVLPLIGYLPDDRLMRRLGLKVDPDDLTTNFDEETFETPVEGCFLCGTITAGVHTEKVFIENGREHAERIARVIAERQEQE